MFSTDVFKPEKHMLSPCWYHYPPNLIFAVFAPISCQNVLKIKMNKTSQCANAAEENIAANRTYVSKNMISWVYVEHWGQCLQDKDVQTALRKSSNISFKVFKIIFGYFWVSFAEGGLSRPLQFWESMFAIIFIQSDKKSNSIFFTRAVVEGAPPAWNHKRDV